MKTWTNSLAMAALATTLTLAGCTEDGPGSVSALPDPEPGDPAIYAPDGWPLQIGDKVSIRRRTELEEVEFPSLGSVGAINVVAGRTYGARWGNGAEAVFLPDEDITPALKMMVDHGVTTGWHYVYEGHFRETVNDMYWRDEHQLPEHLHGRIEYHEDVKRLRDPNKQRRWEENRARMRAEGLLPPPEQLSPVRKR